MTTREAADCPARGWDSYDAYLFDIDGTLLHCKDAVHYFAFCDALARLANRPLNLDGVVAHGNTDVGILRDALTLAEVAECDWRPRVEEAKSAMCRFVEERKAELRVHALAGAVQMVRHLKKRGALVGVATGNLAVIGRLKLEQSGLLGEFDFGGYSDQFEYRSDVFSGALAQVHALAGKAAGVCVVGDTPADIQAARTNQCDVIAVATGVYSYQELQIERPDWCLRSLTDLLAPDTP